MQITGLRRRHRPVTPQIVTRIPEPSATLTVLHYARARASGSISRRALTMLGVIAGAALVAASGVIHLHLWADGYRSLPTVGRLFLFQGIAGVVIAVALLAWPRLVVVAVAVGFLVATVGGLLISAYAGLFGVRETLAAPFAGLSLAVESAGIVALGAVGTALIRGAAEPC
jgi:hypothetical protein